MKQSRAGRPCENITIHTCPWVPTDGGEVKEGRGAP